MNKKIVAIVVIVFVVAIVGILRLRGVNIQFGVNIVPKATSDVTGKSAEKKVEVVKRGDFQMRISATGNLEPLIDVEVKSNVEGEVVRLYVSEGQHVEKDQVLLEIDPEQFQEDEKQAEANVNAAKAQLEQAKLNINLKVKELDSTLRQATDNVEIAKANLTTTLATTGTQLTQADTQIQTTKNDLAQDNIALEQANIALTQAELRLAELEVERDSAKVALDTAQAELNRSQELFDKKLIAKKSLEEAETRHATSLSQNNSAVKRFESQQQAVSSQKKTIDARESAIETRKGTLKYQELNREKLGEMREAEEKGAQLQLQIVETRLTEIDESIEDEEEVTKQTRVGAEANLLRNESSLKNQQERLGWTTIKAPMAGAVTLLEIEEGEIVTSGRSSFSQSPPLMTIADLSKMVVKTYINEVDMERLRLDQEAEIKVDAYAKKKYKGRVAEISPSGEERDNIITFEVMVEVVGSPQELMPGMSADVDIITYKEKNVLLLPIDAIEDKTSVTITAEVNDVSPFKEKQPIKIMTPTEKTFKGHVRSIGGSELIINLDSSQRGLRPGKMTLALLAKGKQIADGVPGTINIVKEKLVILDKGESEEKRKGPPKGRKIPIETGMQNETEVIIKSGLFEGDRVILPPRNKPPAGAWRRG